MHIACACACACATACTERATHCMPLPACACAAACTLETLPGDGCLAACNMGALAACGMPATQPLACSMEAYVGSAMPTNSSSPMGVKAAPEISPNTSTCVGVGERVRCGAGAG